MNKLKSIGRALATFARITTGRQLSQKKLTALRYEAIRQNALLKEAREGKVKLVPLTRPHKLKLVEEGQRNVLAIEVIHDSSTLDQIRKKNDLRIYKAGLLVRRKKWRIRDPNGAEYEFIPNNPGSFRGKVVRRKTILETRGIEEDKVVSEKTEPNWAEKIAWFIQKFRHNKKSK